MIDVVARDAELRARLRAQIPELLDALPAEDADENQLRLVLSPAVFTLLEVESDGRIISGSRAQLETWRWRVGLVVEGVGSREATLQLARSLNQKIKQTLVGWKHLDARKGLVFVKTEFAGRSASRVFYEHEFQTQVYETYN